MMISAPPNELSALNYSSAIAIKFLISRRLTPWKITGGGGVRKSRGVAAFGGGGQHYCWVDVFRYFLGVGVVSLYF